MANLFAILSTNQQSISMEGRPRRQYVSALVPHSTALIAALLIATAAADSAVGSSLLFVDHADA